MSEVQRNGAAPPRVFTPSAANLVEMKKHKVVVETVTQEKKKLRSVVSFENAFIGSQKDNKLFTADIQSASATRLHIYTRWEPSTHKCSERSFSTRERENFRRFCTFEILVRGETLTAI